MIARRDTWLARMLTVVLPAISVVAAGGIVHGWLQPGGRVVAVDRTKTVTDVTASDVRYDGEDDHGRRFSITAALCGRSGS